MRRNIVHLIRGEAGNAYEAIIRDLVQKFDVFPFYNRFPPHLTLKRGFELTDEGLKDLYGILDAFAADHTQSDYRLHGFGHFREDAIYIDVQPSIETSTTVRELIALLRGVKDMEFHEYDDVENDLHATLVIRELKVFDYDQIWNYLNAKDGMDFNMKFDNIAVLRRETDKWVIDRIWQLPIP